MTPTPPGAPSSTSAALTATSSATRAVTPTLPPHRQGGLLAEPTPGTASACSAAHTPIGSAALGLTPPSLGTWSTTSTAVGSAALAPTPPSLPLQRPMPLMLQRQSPLFGSPVRPHSPPPASPASMPRSAPSKGLPDAFLNTVGHSDRSSDQRVLGHVSIDKGVKRALLPSLSQPMDVDLTNSASTGPGCVSGLSNGGAPSADQVQRAVKVYTRRKKQGGRPPAGPRPKEPREVIIGPRTVQETIKQGLCLSPEASILGPRPTASAPVRRKKTIPQDFTPRRSERLIKKGDGKSKGPYHNAQCVLAKRLGLTQEDEEVTDDALEQYLKLFNKPLAPQHLRAIAALFVPDEVDFDEPAYSGFQAFLPPEEIEPCA